MLENPQCMNDINMITIYGNQKKYCNAFFNAYLKRLYSLQSVKKNSTMFDDFEYEYSDYHFEFNYTIKAIPFIKSIVMNTSISKKQILFYAKNIDDTDKSDHLPLLNIMERYNHVKFILSSKNLSRVHTNVTSHTLLLNISFDDKNVYRFLQTFIGADIDKEAFEKRFLSCHRNLLVYISEQDIKCTKLYKTITSTLDALKKERTQLNVVTKIRELCYKLYHLNVRLSLVCKIVLEHYQESKFYKALVQVSADCEHEAAITTKNILVYEHFLLSVYKIIKT